MDSSAYRTPDEAAAKIQAVFRGYQTRKERRRAVGSTQLPSSRTNERPSLSTKRMDPDVAATRIQATFRGYEARKNFGRASPPPQRVRHHYPTLETLESLLPTSCLISSPGQIGSRSHHQYGRQYSGGYPDPSRCSTKAVGLTDPNGAATRIQASFRGYQTRKILQKENAPMLATNRPPQHHKVYSFPRKNDAGQASKDRAATVIQAGFRGYLTRKNYHHQGSEMLRPTHVNRVSNRIRPYSTLKYENDPERAATKIQATYRGYLIRKRVDDTHSSV